MYVTLLQVHSRSLCCRIITGLHCRFDSSCCKFGTVVAGSFSIATGAEGSLHDHYYLAIGSLLHCCQIRMLLQVQFWSLQDHSIVATGSQFCHEATRSFCYALKGNQRGMVASYREPFDSVTI